LQKEINILKISKNRFEQEILLANHVTINDISYIKNENIDKIIKVIANVINFDLHKNDVLYKKDCIILSY